MPPSALRAGRARCDPGVVETPKHTVAKSFLEYGAPLPLLAGKPQSCADRYSLRAAIHCLHDGRIAPRARRMPPQLEACAGFSRYSDIARGSFFIRSFLRSASSARENLTLRLGKPSQFH